MPRSRNLDEWGLNDRQHGFVREYLVDGNATKAAIRAGYAPRSAQMQSSKLLSKPMVRQAIAAGKVKLNERIIERTAITKQHVIDMAMETVQMAREEREAAAMRGAVELVGKLHGYIVDRKEMRVIREPGDLADEELAALEAAAQRERDRRGVH